MTEANMVKIGDIENLSEWELGLIEGVQEWMIKFKIKRYVLKEYGRLNGEDCCIHVYRFEDEGDDPMDDDDPQLAVAHHDVMKLEDIARKYEDEGNPKGAIIPYFGDVWMFLTGYM